MEYQVILYWNQQRLGTINRRLDNLVEELKNKRITNDVDERDFEGIAALHMAARCGREDAVSILVECGADFNIRDDQGETPLHFASTGKVAKILLESGADIEAKNNNGQTPLHLAASRIRDEQISVLIEFGADVGVCDNYGRTALHYALSRKVAAILLDNGADIHARDKWGQTALRRAIVVSKDVRHISLLLEYGAVSDSQADDGETPLSCVLKWHHNHVKHLLLASISLNLAGLAIPERNIKTIAHTISKLYFQQLHETSNFDLNEFKHRCLNEVNQMRCHKLNGVKSLYSVLFTANPMYISNKSLVHAISNADLSGYPLYGLLLKKLLVIKIANDKLRYELILTARKCFNRLVQIGLAFNGTAKYKLPFELEVRILLYLDNEDLEKIIACNACNTVQYSLSNR